MKPFARVAILLPLLVLCAAAARPEKVELPQIDGQWWQIAGNPDLGPPTSPKQEPVDFAIWPAADGSWQLLSCIRGTKCGGKTRLLYRWEGPSITKNNWKAVGIAMQADPSLGETPGGLQAPYVFRVSPDKPFHMLYGDFAHICLATSEDGKTFTRRPVKGRSGRFGEGENDNARDPFAIKIGDLWHIYYTAHPNRHGATYCRTTHDFETFSESQIVAAGGIAGSHSSSAECPQVIQRGGTFYLFRTVQYKDKPLTHIYASTDPMDFGVNDDRCHIGALPVAAPEFLTHEGREYVAALMPDLRGIRVAKLRWTPDERR